MKMYRQKEWGLPLTSNLPTASSDQLSACVPSCAPFVSSWTQMETFFFSGVAFLTLLEYSLFYLGCTRIFHQWYNYFFLGCNSFRLRYCLFSPPRVQSFLPRVQLSFLPRVQHFPTRVQLFSSRRAAFLGLLR